MGKGRARRRARGLMRGARVAVCEAFKLIDADNDGVITLRCCKKSYFALSFLWRLLINTRFLPGTCATSRRGRSTSAGLTLSTASLPRSKAP